MGRSTNKRSLKVLEQMVETVIKNQKKETSVQFKEIRFTPEQLKTLENGGTIELKLGGLTEKFQKNDFISLYKNEPIENPIYRFKKIIPVEEITCYGEFMKALSSDRIKKLMASIDAYAREKGLR